MVPGRRGLLCLSEDVSPAGTENPMEKKSTFRQSRWFTRGWTLQELIAPRHVKFFAGDWSYLGNRNGSDAFTHLLHEITGVQHGVLAGEDSLADISIASRMRWAAFRETTRVEDIAYCLLGLFNVNMPLLYGEGTKAFIRLQEAILLRDDDQSLFAWYTDDGPEELDGVGAVGTVPMLDSLSGLLADLPRRFWNTDDIENAMPLPFTGEPAAVTSKGLRVDLFLFPCADVPGADFLAILSCERRNEHRSKTREAPVVYLKRIWGVGDIFARVRTDLKKSSRPTSVSWKPTSTCLFLSSKTPRRIYVLFALRRHWIIRSFNSPAILIPSGRTPIWCGGSRRHTPDMHGTNQHNALRHATLFLASQLLSCGSKSTVVEVLLFL